MVYPRYGVYLRITIAWSYEVSEQGTLGNKADVVLCNKEQGCSLIGVINQANTKFGSSSFRLNKGSIHRQHLYQFKTAFLDLTDSPNHTWPTE